MVSRAFHIPGIVFLFASFVLLFVVSIGLPFLTALDFVRVHFKGGLPTIGSDTNAVNEIRVSALSCAPAPSSRRLLTRRVPRYIVRYLVSR